MKHVQAKGSTIEEFTSEFKVKKNEVQRVIGRPTYLSLKPLIDAVETNLINMDDLRDPIWGKLHMIQIIAQSANRPAAQVMASTNQGVQDPYLHLTTARESEMYLIEYHREQSYFLNDGAAEDACKELILSRVDEVYLKELHQPRIRYKGITLQQFLNLLTNKY